MDGPYEIGDWVPEQQGRRTDLERGLEVFQAGGAKRVATEEPLLFIKYHRGFAALEGALARPSRRSFARTICVIVGSPGSGKTRWVFDRFEATGLYVSPVGQSKTALWFDGYSAEATALIDDFRGSISYEDFLKLTDPWYSHRVPVKGGYVIWNPDRIIVTSNEPVEAWWPHLAGSPNLLAPLFRRITVYNFDDEAERARLEQAAPVLDWDAPLELLSVE